MANTEKINISVEAKNNTDALSDVTKKLKSLQYGIGSINSGIRQYNTLMSSYNRAVINLFEDMGAAIYDFTTEAIEEFTEFSEQHAKTLGAMANGYDKTLESQEKFIANSEKMKQQAKDLAMYGINGNGSLSNATEISLLQTELVKSGISDDDIVNTDVTKTVLQFAQANELNTEKAVEFAVALGSQFNIPVQEWGGMLDKVSHTADLSIIDVKDIVASMKYAGGVTSGLDRPIEEVLGTISALGNFGIFGSQAGTGIQSLYTRLLTGDTTVVTEAQKAVAPPRALEAFYDFSNYSKSSGSDITYEDIVNETFTDADITGNLRPIDEVIDQLDLVMSELNDEEQAWFAKKFFGLYQMKSAYALINGENGDLGKIVEEIATQSDGTNENKLELLLNSQYGQLISLNNAWNTIKLDFGDKLSPITDSIRDELFTFLSNKGNYNINWDNIRSAIDQSCDAIEESYGSAISEGVRKLGNMTIDLGIVAEELLPEFASGIAEVFTSAISLDAKSTINDWNDMIRDMKDSADGLPEELQAMADTLIDVVDMLGKLAAFNVVSEGVGTLSSMLLVLSTMSTGVTKMVALLGGIPVISGILGAMAIATGLSFANDRVSEKSERGAISYNAYKDSGVTYEEGAASITTGMRTSLEEFYDKNNIIKDGTVGTLLQSQLETYVAKQNKDGHKVTTSEFSSLMVGLYDEYKKIIDGTSGLTDYNGSTLSARSGLGNEDFMTSLYEKDKYGNIKKDKYTSIYAEMFDYASNFKFDESMISDDSYRSASEVLGSAGAELVMNGENVNVNGKNITITGAIDKNDMGITDSMVSKYDTNTILQDKVKESEQLSSLELALKAFSPDANLYGYDSGYTSNGAAILDVGNAIFNGIPNLIGAMADSYNEVKTEGDTKFRNDLDDGLSNLFGKKVGGQNSIFSPNIGITVNLDKDGNVVSQEISMLGGNTQTFKGIMNEYYSRSLAQNGKSTK